MNMKTLGLLLLLTVSANNAYSAQESIIVGADEFRITVYGDGSVTGSGTAIEFGKNIEGYDAKLAGKQSCGKTGDFGLVIPASDNHRREKLVVLTTAKALNTKIKIAFENSPAKCVAGHPTLDTVSTY